jgi:hypothetical protein
MTFVFQGNQGKTSLLQNNKKPLPVMLRWFIHMEGILHTYNHDMLVSEKYYIHPRNLLHSNASLHCCMLLNQMVHSFAQEPLPILAPTLSLRNTIVVKQWVLKGFHSKINFLLP